MKLLVTGFEPFGGEDCNPSWEIAAGLPDRVGDWALVKLRLPTVYGLAGAVALDAMGWERPDAVLCLGQAGGRDAVTPERVAINVCDSPAPDNGGTVLLDQPIAPGGPAAYFTTLPNEAMVRAMEEAGVPARISNTAGTFVCNDLLYRVLREIDTKKLSIRAGFVHVPYLPRQAAGRNVPALPLSRMIAGLTAAVAALSG